MEEIRQLQNKGETAMDIQSLRTAKTAIEEIIKSLSIEKEALEKRILDHKGVFEDINKMIEKLTGKAVVQTSVSSVVAKEPKQQGFGLVRPAKKEDSLKDACLIVVNTSDKRLRPADVKKILREENHPKSKLSSFDSNVPHCLAASFEKGEIDRDKEGRTPYYKKKKPIANEVLSLLEDANK